MVFGPTETAGLVLLIPTSLTEWSLLGRSCYRLQMPVVL